MGRFSLLLARSLKIVGMLLALPLVIVFLFLLPFSPVEIGTNPTFLAMLGLAALGGLLFGIGKIIAPKDAWFDAKGDGVPLDPDAAEEVREFPPKQTE